VRDLAASPQDVVLQYGALGAICLFLIAALVVLGRYINSTTNADRAQCLTDKATLATNHERERAEWQTSHEREREDWRREMTRQQEQYETRISELGRRADKLDDDLRRIEADYRERGTATLQGTATALTDALRELRRAPHGD
jgi:hypothetical protein